VKEALADIPKDNLQQHDIHSKTCGTILHLSVLPVLILTGDAALKAGYTQQDERRE
jgi:hypothetical protein